MKIKHPSLCRLPSNSYSVVLVYPRINVLVCDLSCLNPIAHAKQNMALPTPLANLLDIIR